MVETYLLFIFDKPTNFEKYSLLCREAALIPNYQIKLLDTDSVEAFKPKIAYHCDRAPPGTQCALTDKYGCLIVRIRPPLCFFDLREMLLTLGYRSYAQDIHWQTKV